LNCAPLLFLIFNRPESTLRVFERIRQARPELLFIAADGPRPDRAGEEELCAAAREVARLVDWPCRLETRFLERNAGCREAVSSALDWFFQQVEEGIVLEDDCLPEPSFFPFCSELLERYRGDARVGMISGNNFGFPLYREGLSYSFSRHGLIWGWATWKRAWAEYGKGHALTEVEAELVKANISQDPRFVERWWEEAGPALRGEMDTWDYLWGVTRYRNNFLVVRPAVNLVGNIGFGAGSTHTTGVADPLYEKTRPISFPLVHPELFVPDRVADEALETQRLGLSQGRLESFLCTLKARFNEGRGKP
jgi:hypothetical protein